jgi:hypothetical protein
VNIKKYKERNSKFARGSVVVRPSWPGHPDCQKTNLIRGVVVVRLRLPGDPGYKKYLSEKKNYKRERIVVIHIVFKKINFKN